MNSHFDKSRLLVNLHQVPSKYLSATECAGVGESKMHKIHVAQDQQSHESLIDDSSKSNSHKKPQRITTNGQSILAQVNNEAESGTRVESHQWPHKKGSVKDSEEEDMEFILKEQEKLEKREREEARR